MRGNRSVDKGACRGACTDQGNAVCPGPVKTERWSEMPEAEREAMYRETARRLPVGRIGEAQDLAQTYLYLMQEAYSTGQVIVVDGGAVLV